ncbi:GntR family transcriptional regulator [Sedimentibacter sp.]|uniref:GntR family transcriptional regulator n=1 Tax=Sedimentibacter sp. TaxID=1960295 RepID=UPI00289717BA|nr:GntR family transcriptional regulator [Sedimentibacter sp.]
MINLPRISTKGTLSEKTYDTLKNAIIGLDLKPGELINEEELAEQLGVSRTPIRTALNSLLHEELIELVPGKGTRITYLSKKQINDLLTVREVLECLSIQLASEMRTEDDLEKIEYIIAQQEDAYKGIHKNHQTFLNYDYEFHMKIAEITKNRYIEKQLSQLVNNCRRYLNATTMDDSYIKVLNEHKDIFIQIKNQDKVNSQICIKNHINSIKLRMIECINN